MATSLRAPELFNFSSSDLASEWKMWRRQFEYFSLATRKDETDEEVIVGVLITLLGVEGLKIFDTFVFTSAGDAKKIKPVLDKFGDHFEPLKSEVFERFKFLRRHQLPGESFDSWIVCLRGMAKGCNYGASVESVLRDQVVLGVADSQTREKLLFEKTLTLAKACDIVRSCEASRAQLSQMSTDLPTRRLDDSVNRLTEKSHKKGSGGAGAHHRGPSPQGGTGQSFVECSANALSTGFKDQPARRGTHMQLNSVESEVGDGYSAPGDSEWSKNLTVDDVKVTAKLDSGASYNVMPQEVVINGAVHVVDFVVVDEPGQPTILGLPSCKKLDLIRRVHAVTAEPDPSVPPIVKEFVDVFTGLGKLPVEHTIKFGTGTNYVDPVVSAAGRLPFRLEEPVYRKLDQMVAEEILVPVTEPTEWVSRMLVASKPDGDIRICFDRSELNKAIQRQHFTVPTVEQLFAKIGKAKFFCSLDAASGFYQIPLSTASSFLCTMAIPRGRYRFLRLPFGLKSAPEVYLQTMDELFGDLQGVIIYFDVFLGTRETKEELDDNLRKVLEWCRQHGLKLQLK
ncbi:uncharacterized protein LOC123477448 [Daphnia magna]|uniref:uncharacterized protein LOC123477448 n=1 Tax=Daphnia magna TaxID=35525 RepID=UPI001E1BC2B6|nr:uncharacterized protein LOC123477448 [Daphnia magna]